MRLCGTGAKAAGNDGSNMLISNGGANLLDGAWTSRRYPDWRRRQCLCHRLGAATWCGNTPPAASTRDRLVNAHALAAQRENLTSARASCQGFGSDLANRIIGVPRQPYRKRRRQRRSSAMAVRVTSSSPATAGSAGGRSGDNFCRATAADTMAVTATMYVVDDKGDRWWNGRRRSGRRDGYQQHLVCAGANLEA
jgi:hypothetical protein